MDKIYSRTRIKIPKITRKKTKKIPKWQRFLMWILAILLIAIGSFIYTAYPIFMASCQTAAGSKAIHIVNDEVQNVMSRYHYNDLMDIEKDSNGEIVLMKYNTVLINEITSRIASQIQKSIDETPRITVYINFGSVSRNQCFEKYGT